MLFNRALYRSHSSPWTFGISCVGWIDGAAVTYFDFLA
jgi:hypothetical protein